MCDPVTLTAVSFAASAGTGTADAITADRVARAQHSGATLLHRENRRRTNEAAKQEHQGITDRRVEEREARTVEYRNIQSDADSARGSSLVRSLESSGGGASLGAILRTIERQRASSDYEIDRSEDFAERQFNRDAQRIQDQRALRVAATKPQPLQRPSFLNSALRIAADSVGSAAQTYSSAGGFS